MPNCAVCAVLTVHAVRALHAVRAEHAVCALKKKKIDKSCKLSKIVTVERFFFSHMRDFFYEED